MADRFDDIEFDGVKNDQVKSRISLEDVLRFMIDNKFESIQIEGFVDRFDKTRGIAHRVRRFKNNKIPVKE